MVRATRHFSLVAGAFVLLGTVAREARTQADEKPPVFVIEGIVVDSSSNPLPGMDVLLLHRDSELSTTRLVKRQPADRSGRFVFEGVARIPESVPEKGRYSVLAVKDDVPAAIQFLGYWTGFPITLQADVREATTVKGVVTGPDRKPQSGVAIWVEMIHGDRRPGSRGLTAVFAASSGIEPFQTTTDEAGRFEFRNMPKGMEVRFEVQHDAFARQRVTCTAPATVDVNLEAGAVLHGQVLYADTNRPAAHALVGVELYRELGTAAPRELARAVADKNGRYRIASLKPGRYNVWADQEGWTIQAQEGHELKAGESNPALFLNLIRGGIIKGRIVDEQGTPVAPGDRSNIQWHGPARPRTGLSAQFAAINPDGTFQIRTAPGENWLGFVLTGEWKSVTGGGPIVKVAEGETVEIRHVVKPK